MGLQDSSERGLDKKWGGLDRAWLGLGQGLGQKMGGLDSAWPGLGVGDFTIMAWGMHHHMNIL